MKLLVLQLKDENGNQSTGNIDIRNFGYFFVENVSNYVEVMNTLVSKNLNVNNYKFCIVGEDQRIPFLMKVKDKMSMQIMEFEFDIVTIEEFGLSEEQIKNFIIPNLLQKKQDIYNSQITEIFKAVSEISDNKNLKNHYEELVNIDKELKDFDKTKYLKMQL